jgi:hypothetical protein
MDETSSPVEAEKVTFQVAIEQVNTQVNTGEVAEGSTGSEVVGGPSKPSIKVLEPACISGSAGRSDPKNGPVNRTSKQETSSSKVKQGKSASPRNAESPNYKQGRIRYVEQSRLDAELARLQELSAAASGGDTVALDKLRTALDTCPHIWRRLADLQFSIECRLATLVAEGDLLKLEAIRKRSAELRQELVGSSDTMIVKMTASRYVASWVFAQFLELTFVTSAVPQPCLKLLVQAERRVAIALKALTHAKLAEAQMRRMHLLNSK